MSVKFRQVGQWWLWELFENLEVVVCSRCYPSRDDAEKGFDEFMLNVHKVVRNDD